MTNGNSSVLVTKLYSVADVWSFLRATVYTRHVCHNSNTIDYTAWPN